MKIFTVILLVLFINPAIAYEPHSLYEKSGGYERSGGYETSRDSHNEGYSTSAGYERSIEGYQKSLEGYEPYVVDNVVDTKRIEEKRYDRQMEKSRLIRGERSFRGARMTRGRWMQDRIRADGTQRDMRGAFRQSGGNDDLIDNE
ncbi:MAG: hypothetical protein V3R32_04150 [Nitrosomonadaceae bacterium]